VGTSAWVKPQWRGAFYPSGLAQRLELEFVSRRLSSLEINMTFHRLATAASVEKWRDETPESFVFSVKGYGPVTARRAANARAPLADFFASGILRLGANLGPLLWQLPEDRKLQLDEVAEFIALLPRSVAEASALAAESRKVEWIDTGLADAPLRHAVEIRNETFVDAAFVELMRANDIAVAQTNGPQHPQLHEVTSDFVYVRLSSGPGHFFEGYDDETLDGWAARIKGWLGEQRDVFVYFNNPDGDLPHTPFNAVRLIERLDRDSQPRG
jgi:uncharacterized protein YecE (DUF72 family)